MTKDIPRASPQIDSDNFPNKNKASINPFKNDKIRLEKILLSYRVNYLNNNSDQNFLLNYTPNLT